MAGVNQNLTTLKLIRKFIELIIRIMNIERTENEVIIRLPANVDTEGLQRFIDNLNYKEATVKSEAPQTDVDQLAAEVKKGW